MSARQARSKARDNDPVQFIADVDRGMDRWAKLARTVRRAAPRPCLSA